MASHTDANFVSIGWRWKTWVRFHHRTCVAAVVGILGLWLGVVGYAGYSLCQYYQDAARWEAVQTQQPAATITMRRYEKSKEALLALKPVTGTWREVLQVVDAARGEVQYTKAAWNPDGWTIEGRAPNPAAVQRMVRRLHILQKGKEIHERQQQSMEDETVVFTVSGRNQRARTQHKTVAPIE